LAFIREFFAKNRFLLISFVLIFFFFQQDDLFFTARVSLNFFSLKPWDFYEIAAKNMGSVGQINYLPSTYLLFALWGLPLKLFGIQLSPTEGIGLAVFWYKLLPALFYLMCAVLMKTITQHLVEDRKVAEQIALLWLVSPLAFFSQFTFGQYDSFTLFFALLGISYYFKKDLTRFTWCFAVALTFKYFSAFLFFPLLLAMEKDLKKITKFGLLFLIPLVLEMAPYLISGSNEFKLGVLGFSAAHRVFGVEVNNGSSSFNLLFSIWAGICAYAYFWESDSTDWKERIIAICGLSWMMVFFFIYWHPQWLILMSPFMTLNLIYKKNFKDYLKFQLILMAVAMVLFSLNWPGNVDQTLLKLGVLGKWGPNIWATGDVMNMRNLFLIRSSEMWLSFFNALLVISLIFTFRGLVQGREKIDLNDIAAAKKEVVTYSIVSVWMFPAFALLAYLITLIRDVWKA
jgi:hypothetical protein